MRIGNQEVLHGFFLSFSKRSPEDKQTKKQTSKQETHSEARSEMDLDYHNPCSHCYHAERLVTPLNHTLKWEVITQDLCLIHFNSEM